MSFSYLLLERGWDLNEWPEHVDVVHAGKVDHKRYVPERTCRMDAPTEGEYQCSECGHLNWETYGTDKGWYPPKYCAHCGAKVVEE